MNAVGIVSIALGVLVACARLPLALAPAATLRWFKRLIETNRNLRIFGAALVVLGATLVWAGSTADTTLASVLEFFGWLIIAISTFLLVIFPAAYRAFAIGLLPPDDEENLRGWRLIGILGTIAGLVLIYFGALAL